MERHAVLYFIEQGLMPQDRQALRVGGRPRVGQTRSSATFQDYDWADEVLHAQIGRDWYIKEFGDSQEAVEYGDECWSRDADELGELARAGPDAARNWWPELYREWCRVHGREPDPHVLGVPHQLRGSPRRLEGISARQADSDDDDRSIRVVWKGHADLLVRSPAEVTAQRGHVAVHDASRARWKYLPVRVTRRRNRRGRPAARLRRAQPGLQSQPGGVGGSAAESDVGRGHVAQLECIG